MIQIHTPVNLIVVNDKKQILLVKRATAKDGYKDAWSIPGGGLEGTENFETAISREIKEELDCEIKHMDFFRSYFMELAPERHARCVYFYGQIEGDIKLREDELSEYKWFDIDDPELLKLNYAYNQADVIRDFLEFLKK
jgi:8-oxo-dGTP diphosphatase